MNIYNFQIIPWVELMAGVLHITLFVVFVVVMASLGSKNSRDFIFLQTNYDSSGWENRYISWNVGMLTCVWSLTGMSCPT